LLNAFDTKLLVRNWCHEPKNHSLFFAIGPPCEIVSSSRNFSELDEFKPIELRRDWTELFCPAQVVVYRLLQPMLSLIHDCGR